MRRGMRIRGMAREETTEYPLAVVREALVNAIAHRDYSIRGEGIRLLMFSDRLEVYSPGRLPGPVEGPRSRWGQPHTLPKGGTPPFGIPVDICGQMNGVSCPSARRGRRLRRRRAGPWPC